MNLGNLRRRFPEWNEFIGAFSFIVFAAYSWTIYSFFDQIPSSLLSQSLGQIAVVFCYEMAFALVESLIVSGFILLLCFVLPRGWVREGFAYKGFLIALVWTAAFILMRQNIRYPLPMIFYGDLVLCLLALIVLFFFFNKYEKGRKVLLFIVERFSIFAYVYLPLGVIGLIVVLIQSLF